VCIGFYFRCWCAESFISVVGVHRVLFLLLVCIEFYLCRFLSYELRTVEPINVSFFLKFALDLQTYTLCVILTLSIKLQVLHFYVEFILIASPNLRYILISFSNCHSFLKEPGQLSQCGD
jgi:uncharacterized membrane protein YesL